MQVPYQNSIQYWRDRQKPVKEKNLKIYKILAILAIIAFFPLGIPALWQAIKLKEDFYNGLEKGMIFLFQSIINLYLAKKFHHFYLLSFDSLFSHFDLSISLISTLSF